MAMTDSERRAYARGYNAGAKWPAHQPPYPPEPIIANLMAAMRKMRDTFDNELAMLFSDYNGKFDPLMDECDNAMAEITEWLKGTTDERSERDG